MQERAGTREAALRTGALLSDRLPPGAIPFLGEQRMLAVGSVDDHGEVSATVLFGARGFVSSADGDVVVVDRRRVHVDHDDPLWSNLRVDVEIGLLAIELSSRRRLRVNGVVSAMDEERIEVRVREAYPNCPKYIQRRHLHECAHDAPGAEAPQSGAPLDELRLRVVERADTLFVASRHPVRGLDVSHRGGAPGFVEVLDSGRLRVPDYPGNNMFNTLGNFAVDDRASMAFLDFDRGRLLQMTGTATLWPSGEEDPRQPTGGTGRYWDFHVSRWIELPVVANFAWELLEYSPHNPTVAG
jgi:hypothetical protein